MSNFTFTLFTWTAWKKAIKPSSIFLVGGWLEEEEEEEEEDSSASVKKAARKSRGEVRWVGGWVDWWKKGVG